MQRRGYLAAAVGGVAGVGIVGLLGFLVSVRLSGGICGLDGILPGCHMGEIWFHFVWSAGGAYLGMVVGCLAVLRLWSHNRAGRTAVILGGIGLVAALPWLYLVMVVVGGSNEPVAGAISLTVGGVVAATAIARRLSFLGVGAEKH